MIKDQPKLHLVHRLDRVTSGLIILAKNKDSAAKICEDIRNNKTSKFYLARIKGKFPGEISKINKISIDEMQKCIDAYLCDSSYNDINCDNEDFEFNDNKKRDRESDNFNSIGNCKLDHKVTKTNYDELVQSKDVSISIDSNGIYYLKCPVGVVSYKDGIHACALDGKPSFSSFEVIKYDPLSDTTVVQCRPFTGRTHQLRLHLQFLGSPIANDPCYGGDLFFGKEEKKEKAYEILREMKRIGYHPISKLPHINDPEFDEITKPPIDAEKDVKDQECSEEFETEEQFLKKNCRYCAEREEMAELERILHCDGIWLHALKYQGEKWSFQTPYPTWASI